MYDNKESSDTKSKKSKDLSSSTLLIDLFHSQTKRIVSAVLTLTRQHEIDNNLSSKHIHSLSPINDREQMQLVKNIAIAVRDLLQTLDYAPVSIKEMVDLFVFSFFEIFSFFLLV